MTEESLSFSFTLWSDVLAAVISFCLLGILQYEKLAASKGSQKAAKFVILPIYWPVLLVLGIGFIVLSLLLALPGPYPSIPSWFNGGSYGMSPNLSGEQQWKNSQLYWTYWTVFEFLSEGFGIMLLHRSPSRAAFASTFRFALLYAVLSAAIATLGFNYALLGVRSDFQTILECTFLGFPCIFYALLIIPNPIVNARKSLIPYAIFSLIWRLASIFFVLVDTSTLPTTIVASLRSIGMPIIMYLTLILDTLYWKQLADRAVALVGTLIAVETTSDTPSVLQPTASKLKPHRNRKRSKKGSEDSKYDSSKEGSPSSLSATSNLEMSPRQRTRSGSTASSRSSRSGVSSNSSRRRMSSRLSTSSPISVTSLGSESPLPDDVNFSSQTRSLSSANLPQVSPEVDEMKKRPSTSSGLRRQRSSSVASLHPKRGLMLVDNGGNFRNYSDVSGSEFNNREKSSETSSLMKSNKTKPQNLLGKLANFIGATHQRDDVGASYSTPTTKSVATAVSIQDDLDGIELGTITSRALLDDDISSPQSDQRLLSDGEEADDEGTILDSNTLLKYDKSVAKPMSVYVQDVSTKKSTEDAQKSEKEKKKKGKKNDSNYDVAIAKLTTTHSSQLIDFTQLLIGQYLDQGATSTVYAGLLSGSIEVAIKVFSPEKMDESTIAFFAKEHSIAAALKHPHIVRYFGLAVCPPTLSLVFELCHRGSLYGLIDTIQTEREIWEQKCIDLLESANSANSSKKQSKSRKQTTYGSTNDYQSSKIVFPPEPTISWRRRLRMAKCGASALAYLHSFDPPFLHRDVKSQNFMVTANYEMKLSDFGESRARSTATSSMNVSSRMSDLNRNNSSAAPMTGEIGTAQWMAPEVMRGGEGSYDTSIDIYSYGIVLWELASLSHPHVGISDRQLVYLVLMRGMRPAMPEWIHPNLVTLITKCWDENPNNRPTALEIQAALEDIDPTECEAIEKNMKPPPETWLQG
jgi:Protein tyrosine and serine/threonine kinase